MKLLPSVSCFVVGFHTWALDPGLSPGHLAGTAAPPQNYGNARTEGERGAWRHWGGLLVSYGTGPEVHDKCSLSRHPEPNAGTIRVTDNTRSIKTFPGT